MTDAHALVAACHALLMGARRDLAAARAALKITNV
jgi:hypothetical protein